MTRALIEDQTVPAIFEAAFDADGVRVRCDLLERLPGGRWALHEVKGSKEPKDDHYEDLAVQAHVLRAVGLDLDRVGLVHLNAEYVRAGDETDWAELFTLADLTEELADWQDEVKGAVKAMTKLIRAASPPAIEPGLHCPGECEFLNRCTAGKPDDWIRYLPRISATKFAALRDLGCESIAEIPEDFNLTPTQEQVREVLVSGQDYVSGDLGADLAEYGPPAFYLDFETMSPAIPIYPGTSPYELIPFQWSLHQISAGGDLRHTAFLADGDHDPRHALAEALVDALRSSEEPVLMYTGYERRVLNQLRQTCPDLAPDLSAIIDRLIDLHDLVKRHTYLAAYGGSTSIKVVAPALCLSFGYDDLEDVADGSAAADTFERMVLGEVTDREAVRGALLAYCERDTLAMVEVHRALRRRAEGAG